ncbi:JAB1/Mov34/MPN/PAD-1 ubiquitin protease-domain-containing protein [Lactarius quietus]|nr:JAB1/Mov34/MPN/PAD-1 ubiquitin protease-domain-containing protein [Lactarius quietus]
MGIPVEQWPENIRLDSERKTPPQIILSAFEEMERELKARREAEVQITPTRQLPGDGEDDVGTEGDKLEYITFSLTNDIKDIPPQDEIYKFDVDANKRLIREQPWANDPHFFKSCKISAVALIKMVIHARSGVPWEIMGLMQGKVVGHSIVIMDSFALPVQGTETRVNAANEANEYMVQYIQESEKVGRLENAIGWYHSHPGYGCWLSGIDVNTQMNNQKFTDPFVAVVIDPNRTVSAGRVDIGAFRTYPAGYTPPNASSSEYQSIPLNKIEDFGVHANQYYSLEVQIFKSSLDTELLGLLWNKYWVNTLSQSPLISTKPIIPAYPQLERKLLRQARGHILYPLQSQKSEPKKEVENQLAKNVKDGTKIAMEAQHGLIAQVIKDILFSSRPSKAPPEVTASIEETVEMAIG